MKSFKTLAAVILAALASTACSRVETGRTVLLGDITGDPGEVIVVSYLPGQEKGYHYPEVHDGKFEFALDGVEGFADLIVSVGGVEFGARIDVSDTLRMSFVVNKYLEDVTVAYDGAHEKESRIWTDFYETYDHLSNYGIDDNILSRTDFEDILAQLERSDSSFRAKHKGELEDYHTHRADLAHDIVKAFLLELIAGRDGIESFEMPEYVAMIEKVDPNDPDQVVFPMVNRWASYKKYGMEGSQLEKDIQFMRQYGQEITNPDIRRMLADNMAAFAFWEVSADSLEVLEPFIAEIEKFAPNGAEIAADCRGRMEAILNSRPGAPVPDTVLRTPDGQEVNLSSLFGKVIYIDIWATWCGPCLNEGPYFRALAEKYKDNPRIAFVSVSTDSKDKPWLEFLDEEKPFWPQYRLDGEYSNDFCDKVGILTIPRFLLIDAEGRFIDADCARPSDDAIGQILEAALN